MKTKIGVFMLALFMASTNMMAQDQATTTTDSEMLGLPGDNLDLYAVLDLFQKSKTIEEFEASLNDEKTGINNLDLTLDENVDFIKVTTKQDGDNFTFILQVDILKDEVQDVAVILVSKNNEEKVSIQIVGDESLYGKDYIIEPLTEVPPVTANPAYSGPDTVIVQSQPATIVIVESEPIVEYIYAPVYVPYYPPYYYGYYPPYYRPYPVISFHIYFGRHHHHHNHYHGGRRGGNTIIINNNYNNYNRTRKTSNTVSRNSKEGNYKRTNTSTRPATTPTTRPSTTPTNRSTTTPSTRPSTTPSTRPTTTPSTRPSTTPSTRPTTTPSTRPSTRPTTRPSTTPSTRPTTRPSTTPSNRKTTTPATRPAAKPTMKKR